MPNLNKETRTKLLYWMPLIVLAVIFMVMYWLHPYLRDDYWFREPMAAFISSPTWSNFWSGLAESAKYHFMYDNGRIYNLIGSVFVVMPKWIPSIFLGCCCALCVYAGAVLAGVWRRNFVMTSLFAFMFFITLPWFDYMTIMMYAFNYIVTTIVMFVVLTLFIKQRISGRWHALALGLAIGVCHEVFVGTAFCGTVAVFMLYREYRTKTNVWLIVGMLVAVVYLCFVPGTAVRSEDSNLFEGYKNLLLGILFGIPFYVAVLITLICVAVKGWRYRIKSPLFVLCFGAALGGWIIWRAIMSGPRVAWATDAMAIVAIIVLIKDIHVGRKIAIAVSSVLWLVIFGHLLACLPWYVKMKTEHDFAYQLVQEHPGEVVYAHLTNAHEAPAYLLGMPNYNAYMSWRSKFDSLMPPSLIDFCEENSKQSKHGDEALIFDGNIMIPADAAKPNEYIDMWLFYDGKPFKSYGLLMPIKSKTSGKDYLYVKPFVLSYTRCFSPITGVEIWKR